MASLARRRGADGVLLEPGPLLALPGAGEWPWRCLQALPPPTGPVPGVQVQCRGFLSPEVTIPPDYSSQWLPKVLLIGFWTHTVSGQARADVLTLPVLIL